jgi:hypothetical protein
VATPKAFDELRREIVRLVQTVVPDPGDGPTIGCDIEEDGPRLVIHLSGPPVDDRVEQAMAVRVLDAIGTSGRTYGQVSVEYHGGHELVGRR